MEKLTFNQKELIKYGTGIALGTGSIVWIYNKIVNCKERQHFAKLVKERQTEREVKFKELESKYPMGSEVERIASLQLDELQDAIRTRKLSATRVLEAFIAKALDVHKKTNCITEFNTRALEMAAELDKLPEMKGPLHGIPFCVKDDTDVIGMDSTVGYARNLNKPAAENAAIVQVLVDLGAIPFCRTNLPQTCISFASHNPIFGVTLNPLNPKLSPGGSSSGTGALLAGGGAPFGIGTDTGGSARVPSHFCGLSTIKSSKNRVSRKGCALCIDKCIPFVSTPCIMARRPQDVASIFQGMMEDCKHNVLDGKAVPMAWNKTIFESKRPLRIGYHTSLSIFPSMGDTADTVLAAKRAFESVGHTLIPFEIPDSEKYQHLTMRLWNADMGKHLVQNLKNEEVGVVVKHLHAFSSLPRWQKKFYSWLPTWLSPYNPKLLNTAFSAEYSSELWDLMSERRAAIQELLDRMNAQKLDLLLGPAWPFPALKVDDIVQAAGDAGMYSFIWNFMDFPAGIVKVGKESGRHFGDDYPENGMFYRKLARKSIRESVGMPIGVQIIGPPFHEELVLRAMVELEKQIQN